MIALGGQKIRIVKFSDDLVVLAKKETVLQEFIFFSPVALRPNTDHGLLMFFFSISHRRTHHSRYKSSGRVISSSQRPLPKNTQHSQQTSMPWAGFEPTISAGERPQTYVQDIIGRLKMGNPMEWKCVWKRTKVMIMSSPPSSVQIMIHQT